MDENAKTDNATSGRAKFILAGVMAVGALAGLVFALAMPADWLLVPQEDETTSDHDVEAAGAQEFYACPMFCTRLDEPGICPVCGMDMELFVDTGARTPMSPEQRNSIGLKTEPIERRFLAKEISTLGVFEPDETRERVVAAWVDGRIEKLYADFTGVPVEKGWHLFDLYSPELYSAQKELLVARDALERAGDNEARAQEAGRLVETARERLHLLGLSVEQVEYVESLSEPSLTLTIPSPESGTVTEKLAHPGMYVKQGQPVFRVTDLSRLWLIVDIHERDAGRVALGQRVQVNVSALPGETFAGRVGFIDPTLSRATRTIRVRVEVPNPDGRLRPGMYGEASIFAELTDDGRLAAPELKGEYACPMHPLRRAEQPGEACPICGMDMTSAPEQQGEEPGRAWAIPREAVLSTGDRHLVYVEWWVREVEHEPHPAEEFPKYETLSEPEYQGFEVELGPLAAEYHIMEDGTRHKLREYYPLIRGVPTGIPPAGDGPGLRIVTNGQFLIDSQMELTGKPSLLRPQGGEAEDPHAGHGE